MQACRPPSHDAHTHRADLTAAEEALLSHHRRDRLLSRVRQQLLCLVRDTQRHDEDAMDRLERAFRSHMSFMAAHPGIHRVMLSWALQEDDGRLRRRVRKLAGLDATALEQVADSITLTPGARTLVRTLQRLGYQCGIVSGGFDVVTDRLRAELGFDFAVANRLQVRHGRLSGEVIEPVIGRAAKAEALREFARTAGVPLEQTVAIGDGANDLDMLEAAGLGIAFNAKPVVQQAADTSVNVPYLDTILFLLGISRSEVDAISNPTD